MAKNLPRLPNRKLVVTTVLIATVASAMTALSNPPTLRVDGQRITSDVPAVTQAHEAYVPARAVGDGLGAETNYDPKTGTIEMARGNQVLRLKIGEKVATLNGSKMTLGHAPFAVRGRAMVGLRTIARAFGTKVSYDGAKIDVMTPGVIEAGAQEAP